MKASFQERILTFSLYRRSLRDRRGRFMALRLRSRAHVLARVMRGKLAFRRESLPSLCIGETYATEEAGLWPRGCGAGLMFMARVMSVKLAMEQQIR